MAKKKYETPEQLEKAIDKYFKSVTDDKIPTWPDMLLYLDISDDTVERYMKNEKGRYTGFAEPIKRAQLRFTSELIKMGQEKPNLQSFAIFLLKQVHNGGYRDKPKDDPTHTVSLDIKISGCDGFNPGA